eukprot:1814864-Pleurochrysis_carterae.AAC.1
MHGLPFSCLVGFVLKARPASTAAPISLDRPVHPAVAEDRERNADSPSDMHPDRDLPRRH